MSAYKLVFRDDPSPLGIKMKCYCGNIAFTLHNKGKSGFQVKCTSCNKLYSIELRKE